MGIYDRGYYSDDQWKNPEDRRSMGVPRSMVSILIAINVIVFLLDMFSGPVVLPNDQPFDSLRLSYFMALKTGGTQLGVYGPLDNPLYAYELISYGFAHSSITSERSFFHILFNMVALFFLGRPVEQKLGRYEFLRFYMIAIVVSGLIWLISFTVTGRQGIAVGASGAVVAVVMLFVFNFPHEKLLLMGIIPMPAWVLGVLVVGMDALTSVFNPSSGIAVEAHLGGAAFAAAYFFGNWNFGWIRFEWLTRRLTRKPSLKVHDPGGGSDEALSGEADRILDKLHRQGESSLTRRERRILEKYSRQVRDRRK